MSILCISDADRDKAWIEAMKAKGHMPILNDDGSLDFFVLDEDYHNGPGCEICGWMCCHRCDGIDDIPQCLPLWR